MRGFVNPASRRPIASSAARFQQLFDRVIRDNASTYLLPRFVKLVLKLSFLSQIQLRVPFRPPKRIRSLARRFHRNNTCKEERRGRGGPHLARLSVSVLFLSLNDAPPSLDLRSTESFCWPDRTGGTEMGYKVDPRLRESRLLAPSGRGARVHAT